MFRRLLHLIIMLFALTAVSASAADFCWKGSKPRGVGTLPEGCTGGRNKEVGMCYTPCNAGYEGAVTMCLKTCPSGYTNTGLSCHISKPLLIAAKVDACAMTTTCDSGYTNAGLLCGLNTPSVPSGYKALVSGPAAIGMRWRQRKQHRPVLPQMRRQLHGLGSGVLGPVPQRLGQLRHGLRA